MKNKIIFLISFLLISFSGFSQAPANDNCINATNLTVDAPLLCIQTTNATSQIGEQCANYAGQTNRTIWFKFIATNATMVLDILKTNVTNLPGVLSVYGPNPTCVPSSASQILTCTILNGDPGVYTQLTGLTVGATYFIQYNGSDGGGANSRVHNFCIGVYTPASNNTVNTPSVISECGTLFNGTTQGGYFPSGTGTGFRNLDNNNSTTCPSCGAQPGADVTFVINNDSWFSFCSGTAGTWQITFNVGTCVFSGTNSGLQMALFTGTPTNLIWFSQAPSPTYSGGSWVSPNITLNAGECAYLMVDGFAGDACSYSYQLTNISGGCVVLPIELLFFEGENMNNYNHMRWVTASEINNSFFTLERSIDGFNWSEIYRTNGAGTTSTLSYYGYKDYEFIKDTINYYRLKQTDFNGVSKYFEIKAVSNTGKSKPKLLKRTNIMGQEVGEHYQGLVIEYYSDCTTRKVYRTE